MKPNKDKFEFVSLDKESFLLEEDDSIVEEETSSTKTAVDNLKKRKRKRHIVAIIIMLVSSLILFGFSLMWQASYNLMAICNGLWLVFAIEFTVGWFMFVSNKNLFSPLIHGIKTFGLMLVGKKPKFDYYSYTKHIEDNPIPAFYYIVVFVSAAIILIPAVILMIILM